MNAAALSSKKPKPSLNWCFIPAATVRIAAVAVAAVPVLPARSEAAAAEAEAIPEDGE